MKKNTHNQASIFGLLVLFIGLCVPQVVHANAFFIQEMSGDGMAQGAAVVAAGSKPSTMFQNASNLSFLSDGLHLELAATIYIPSAKFEGVGGETTYASDTPQIVPHLFTSYRINDWLAVGLGIFADFGLAVDWPEGWEGSQNVTYAGMTTYTINPNISFGPFKGFAVAVGFDAKWGAIDIRRELTLGLPPLGEEDVISKTKMGGTAWGFGANIGLMYQPKDWVRIGLAYRSAISMNFKGDVDFDVISNFAKRFPDQKFSTKFLLPHLISTGVRFWPVENFSIELDFWYTMWSTYDKLVIKFEDGLELGPGKRQFEQIEATDFNDFIQIRLGAEWWFHEHFALRAGVMLDGGVIPDETLNPMLPDNHRINSCIGLGTTWSGFSFDVAYMLVYMIPRDVSDVVGNPLPGKYSWIVHDVTMSVAYNYDFFAKDEVSLPDKSEDMVLPKEVVEEAVSEEVIKPELSVPVSEVPAEEALEAAPKEAVPKEVVPAE